MYGFSASIDINIADIARALYRLDVVAGFPYSHPAHSSAKAVLSRVSVRIRAYSIDALIAAPTPNLAEDFFMGGRGRI